MRRASSRLRRQQRADTIHPFAGLITATQRLARHAILPWRHPSGVAMLVTLLVSAGALLGAGSGAAHAVPAVALAHPAPLSARYASDAPSVYRWRDPVNSTAFLLGTVPPGGVSFASQHSVARIEFALPNGDNLYLAPGKTSLLLLAALQNLPPGAAFDQVANDCTTGALLPAGTPTAAVPSAGAAQGVQTITANLVIHVARLAADDVLLAYAGLNYALGQDFSVCQQASPRYEVLAGCDATTCSAPLPPAAAVSNYDGAVLAAMTDHHWGYVYILTASTITEQYSAEQFAAAMAQQVSQHGRITAIAPVSAAQINRQTRDGLQFFIVTQAVTVVDTHGASATHQITSYYLFEGAGWKFWFSR
jgi:hypothetical protein